MTSAIKFIVPGIPYPIILTGSSHENIEKEMKEMGFNYYHDVTSKVDCCLIDANSIIKGYITDEKRFISLDEFNNLN